VIYGVLSLWCHLLALLSWLAVGIDIFVQFCPRECVHILFIRRDTWFVNRPRSVRTFSLCCETACTCGRLVLGRVCCCGPVSRWDCLNLRSVLRCGELRWLQLFYMLRMMGMHIGSCLASSFEGWGAHNVIGVVFSRCHPNWLSTLSRYLDNESNRSDQFQLMWLTGQFIPIRSWVNLMLQF